MKARLTLKSGNRKTGPIPTSYSEPETCPDACPLKRNGCYAEGYPVRLHWHAAEKFVPWEDFCAALAALPTGQLWRHNVAGDLPGNGDRLDVTALMLLVRANAGLRGFTYTHKPLKRPLERQSVSLANQLGFTINLSADDLREADELAELGIGPVVVTLPSGAPQVSKTPAGRTVIACPAETRDEVTCETCQLCSVASRKAIVGFRGSRSEQGTNQPKAAGGAMRRSQAADLIDRIREIAAKPTADIALIRALQEAGLAPLKPCTGEAHSNAYIDNCMLCAPRWGFVGKKERVT